MIYQNNDTFKVFPFVAEFDSEIHYIDDKEEFEKGLLRKIRMDKIIDGTYIEDEVLNLPTITYSDFSLSDEQQARFDEITTYSTVTLDDVSDYVFNGLTKNMEFNLNREINSLKDKNTSLEEENTSLKNDMANILMYIASI